MKCEKCGKDKKCRHLVLNDYSPDGGWIEDGMYCQKCEDAIADFMNNHEKQIQRCGQLANDNVIETEKTKHENTNH